MLEIPPPPPPKPRIVLPWSEYDPGLLNGDGVAVRKCSIDFLASLYKTFLDTYRPDEVNLSPEEAERLTESVRQELTRLTNYPDLFPTPTAQERFFKILQESVAKVVKKREDKESESIEESIRLRANLIARDEEQILQSINRPSFKPELKPWEQFLLKGSPGSGVALSEDPPNGYVQMMPMGGLALHRMWLKNTYIETRRYREEVANGSEPASDEHFAQRTPERRMATPKHNRVIDRLESFNDIIARLEGDDVINAHGEESVRVMLYRTTVEDAPDAAE
ncbi:hypothetical protein MGYG_05520 [Nannizzia gypsea CBS 118893]|uniref:Uncharacterized protein n=1 Tax=Arthroderma gypseum (strain ATCC MYA-4604 / CBS 118893) TaxID=535722 RepID=E4UWC9_ARTGP|nr:hypothetical protein MGYG_05520 [Nannizzia gypsea CBS 118893]EFR02524.1 hypothetical protein MGYG_05520 [Nannizzia gypsea CBS 118893]